MTTTTERPAHNRRADELRAGDVVVGFDGGRWEVVTEPELVRNVGAQYPPDTVPTVVRVRWASRPLGDRHAVEYAPDETFHVATPAEWRR